MELEEEYPDRVSETFKNKTIFITGGTGFIGKVLVEKLLRCCTDLKKIYLLVREKKGKSAEERVQTILNDPLFSLLKQLKGESVIDKVEGIPGDVALPNLGICAEDRRKITEESNIIYHCAACIRFDEPLKLVVTLNVKGTKYMLDLAKECKNLLMFVHLSTAYCHLEEKVLYEKVYPPPADPHLIMDIVDNLDEAIVDQLTPKLLNGSPNTYVFTKALAEALVAEEMETLPIIIMRPSIVIPAWLEPIPGWTDNLNGPAGILLAAGKGVIRTMYCNSDSHADFLPVDIGVNGMLLAVFNYLQGNKHRVYNLATAEEVKLTWKEIIDMSKQIVYTKMPFNNVVWYPGGSMKRSKILHKICLFLFHLIPAILADCLLFILGYRPVLLHVQKRITKGFDMFEYFANKSWDFKCDQRIYIREMLNTREKQTYRLDRDGLDIEKFMINCVHSIRVYYLKESDDTLPAARRHMKIMWFVDRFFKTLFFLGLIYFVWTKFIKTYYI